MRYGPILYSPARTGLAKRTNTWKKKNHPNAEAPYQFDTIHTIGTPCIPSHNPNATEYIIREVKVVANGAKKLSSENNNIDNW